jgi:hypothetical protein
MLLIQQNLCHYSAMKKAITLGLISLATASSSFAYSAQGHEGIAEFAHTHVNDQTRNILDKYFLSNNAFINKLNTMNGKSVDASSHAAGAHPVPIMIPADNLGKIAVWADDLKFSLRRMAGTPLLGDKMAAAFNNNFKDNGDWHFLNLPLDLNIFSENSHFNPNQTNVADAIQGAINVLEGRPSGYASAANGNVEFTKIQALHLIVHLVGDIHQPLHVGSGYYQLPAVHGSSATISVNDEVLVTDPSLVFNNGKLLPSDIGGNSVHFSASQELHALWDDQLVQNYAGTTNKDSHVLAEAIANNVTDVNDSRFTTVDQNGQPISDYHRWAAAWATDSVHAAKQVYSGLTFNSVVLSPQGGIASILVTKDASYESDHAAAAAIQLEKAGAHLTQLLNSIHWDLTNIKDNTADPVGSSTTSVPSASTRAPAPSPSGRRRRASPLPPAPIGPNGV